MRAMFKMFHSIIICSRVVFNNFRLSTNPKVTKRSLYNLFESVKDDMNLDLKAHSKSKINETDNTDGIANANVKDAVKIDQVEVVQNEEIIVIDDSDDEKTDGDEIDITHVSEDEIQDSVNTGT